MYRGVVFALLIGFGLVSTGAAQQTGSQQVFPALSPRTLAQIQNNPRDVFNKATQLLKDFGVNGRISREIFAVRDAQDLAGYRAALIRNVLDFDLNGDLAIDAGEISRQLAVSRLREKTRLFDFRKQMDADGDGFITREEWRAAINRAVDRNTRELPKRLDLLEFDMDGDGFVDAAEIAGVIKRITYDGALANRDTKKAAKAQPMLPACGFPTPTENAETVLIGTSKGAALSTATIAGQDKVTTAAVLEIAPGDTPLQLFLGHSEPVIWEIRGDTSRIEAVILRNTAVGITGIAPEKLTFVSGSGCIIPVLRSQGPDTDKHATLEMTRLIGRAPDRVFGSSRIGTLAVPAMTEMMNLEFAKPDRRIFVRDGLRYLETDTGLALMDGPDWDQDAMRIYEMERKVYLKYAAGVRPILPEMVAARQPVEPYAILPGLAGMMQALGSGALIYQPSDGYLITPGFTRFPAGLRGTRFVLPSGLAMPLGKAQDITVLAQDTGECLIGPNC